MKESDRSIEWERLAIVLIAIVAAFVFAIYILPYAILGLGAVTLFLALDENKNRFDQVCYGFLALGLAFMLVEGYELGALAFVDLSLMEFGINEMALLSSGSKIKVTLFAGLTLLAATKYLDKVSAFSDKTGVALGRVKQAGNVLSHRKKHLFAFVAIATLSYTLIFGPWGNSLSLVLVGGLGLMVSRKGPLRSLRDRWTIDKHEQGLVPIGIKENGLPLSLKWRDLNHHIQILGQPGAGKSVLLRNFYISLIKAKKGLLIIDLKADKEVKQNILSLCHDTDRVDDMKIVDLSSAGTSWGYNPLLRGNSSEIKDKIINSLEWSEQYYKKIAENFVLQIVTALVIIRDEMGLVPTLKDLLEMLISPDRLKEIAESLPEYCLDERSNLRALAKQLRDEKTYQALTGLRTDLQVLIHGDLGVITCEKKSFDLLTEVKGGGVVYISLDGQTYPLQSQRLGRMLLSDLRSVSGALINTETTGGNPEFTVIIDEFSDLVSTSDLSSLFTGFLNRCRGSGIGVVIAHQSLGDFKESQAQKQVLDSTETVFSFVQKDPDTCETLASIVGTKGQWAHTEQYDKKDLLGRSTKGSRRFVQEYIYHPNEFKNLATGEAIYIAKKPSRYGKVKIHFSSVPKQNADLPKTEKASQLLFQKLRNTCHDRLGSQERKRVNMDEVT